jgi:hypothetical protein
MEIEYTETASEDLEQLPKRVAEQIVRKISRLENGLHGDINGFKIMTLPIDCALEITGYFLMWRVIWL